MLKEALAANTIGGKADDDSRLRAAQEELRQVQAQLLADRDGAGRRTAFTGRPVPARRPQDHANARGRGANRRRAADVYR